MAQLNINALAEMMSQTANKSIGGVARGIKQQRANTAATESNTATQQFALEQAKKEREMKAAEDEINQRKRAALSPYLRIQPLMDGRLADANGDGVVSDEELAAASTQILQADLNRPGMTAEEKMATEKLLQSIQYGVQSGDYGEFRKKVGVAQPAIDQLAISMKDLEPYTSAAMRERMEQRRQERETSVRERTAGVQERQASVAEGNLALQQEREARLSSQPPAPGFAEKEQIKADTKRRQDLKSSRQTRLNAIETARSFRDQIESGEKSTGSTQAAMMAIPGVFTEQGEFNEQLDAFAERAAREALKAVGEIRPTDADVVGMKRALFGVGKDESTNIKLLDAFIREQEALEQEYQGLQTGGDAASMSDEELMQMLGL